MSDSSAPPPGDRGPRTPAGVVTIRCRENGPLVVEMPLGPDGKPQPLRVTDHHGHELTIPGQKRSVALCRCGQSGTRPWCDGSHKALGSWAAEVSQEPPQQAGDPAG